LAKICFLRVAQTKASQEFSFHICRRFLSERRSLTIEGITRLRDADSALYPLSDDGSAIDHVLGAANYRPLRDNEPSIAPFVRTKWL